MGGIKTASERLAVLETEICFIKNVVEKIDGKLDKIVTNHLPHIQQKLEDQEEKVSTLSREVEAIKKNCYAEKVRAERKLSGKEKALVYVAIITSSGILISEFVKAIFHV